MNRWILTIVLLLFPLCAEADTLEVMDRHYYENEFLIGFSVGTPGGANIITMAYYWRHFGLRWTAGHAGGVGGWNGEPPLMDGAQINFAFPVYAKGPWMIDVSLALCVIGYHDTFIYDNKKVFGPGVSVTGWWRWLYLEIGFVPGFGRNAALHTIPDNSPIAQLGVMF